VSSVSSAAQERDVSAWWKVDLAELLSTLCHHCSDLAGVVACSIVVKSRFGELFSAAGSAEWACALDDFQLSEEAGPTWECCTTGRAIKGERLDHRGLTGAHLGEAASAHGVVGCRAVPLSSQGETFGALSLYWGPSVREENLLPTGIAVAAIAARAIESACVQDEHPDDAALAFAPAPAGDGGAATPGDDPLSEGRDARAAARDLRADGRDVRAAERDARAAERDARAAEREKEDRARAAASGSVDPLLIADQVMARRDRSAAARDRFHAMSDRAAARLDRIVSANERVESSIDGLTGAYRRDAGLLALEHEIARAHRTGESFVLAFVDVNNLKVRNDLHGHIAGDRLLRKIADTLRANVRSYDLVVRYGGDEFICGFPALDVNDGAERFARINEDLAASDEASVAFGLAELARGDSLTELIAKADALMYANRYQRARESDATSSLVDPDSSVDPHSSVGTDSSVGAAPAVGTVSSSPE
jgi:diguanylate cyclase (GGDEF)-like protein